MERRILETCYFAVITLTVSLLFLSCRGEPPSSTLGRSYFYPSDELLVPVEGPGGPGTIDGMVLNEDKMPTGNVTVTFTQMADTDDNPSSSSLVQLTDVSDEFGRFGFTGLPVATYTLEALGENRGASVEVSIGSAGLYSYLYWEQTLTLSPVGDILGRVRDTAAMPVAGAEVQMLPIRATGNFSVSTDNPSTGTNPDGAFAFLSVPEGPTGQCRLFIKADGFAPVLTDVISIRSPDVSITLTQGGRISGTLIAADSSAPLAQQRVFIVGEEQPERYYETFTDASGAFSKDCLRPSTYRIWCEGEKWSHAGERPDVVRVSEGAETTVTVAAVPAAVIKGRVYDMNTEKGIADAEVYAAQKAPLSTQRRMLTGKDGTFEFDGLVPGSYRISCSPYNANATVLVAAGTTFDNIDLAVEPRKPRSVESKIPGLTASGSVVDANGAPVAGAVIETSRRHSEGTARGGVKSNKNGVFSVVYTEGRSTRVAARKDGLLSERVTLTDMSHEGDITLTLSELPVSVVGKVYHSPGGIPYPWAYVYLDGMTNNMRLRSYTTPTGAFRFSGLPPGTYRIHAERAIRDGSDVSPSCKEISERIDITLAQGEERRGIEFRVEGYFPWHVVKAPEGRRTISGRVTARDGAPLYGVRMSARSDAGWARYGKTDIDGRYTIDRLLRGIYTVTAIYPTRREGVRSGSRDVDFVDQRRTVTGAVVDAQTGQPITEFQVGHGLRLYRHEIKDYLRMVKWVRVKDPLGRFTLYRVPGDRPVAIVAQAGGYSTFNHRVVSPGSPDKPPAHVSIALTTGPASE